ncbi:MAG TPA: hypothetical protein VJZ50_09255 [Candidatus Limnocylindrales bacterium]|nr:hypothetical protein [Candidatus Limnocylindrales bacterium]
MQPRDPRTQRAPVVRAAVLAWMLVVGIDFFVNAGMLTMLWEGPSSFLLSTADLFLRIPMGYAALLLWSVLVVWLVTRLHIERPRGGAVFGAKLGMLVSVAGMLGLASISTISATIALGWATTQIVEFAVVGYVGTLALRAGGTRRMTLAIIGLTLLLVAGGLIAQNLI